MKIEVLCREEAEAFNPPPGAVCISIRDAGAPRAELHPRFAAVLHLEFDDVDPESYDYSSTSLAECLLFDRAHAAAIRAFMAEHRDASLLLVHCNAGVSRSPAVALALTVNPAAERRLRERHPYYNRHVLSVLSGVAPELSQGGLMM